jgi:type II secretion system protein J
LRRHGFTLIELMIAIAITALIMAAVGGILVSTLEADQRVSDAMATEKSGYGILGLMRRDLEACYTYALGGPAFQGTRGTMNAAADSMAFVTAVESDPDPTTGRRAKYERVAYQLKQDPSTNAIALYRAAEAYTTPTVDPLGASAFAFIATGLQSLKLSYLDPEDNAWHDDEWSQTDRVPLAVQITLQMVPPSQQQQGQQGSSSFGLIPATTFQTTVGIPTYFSPLADPPTAPGTAPTTAPH